MVKAIYIIYRLNSKNMQTCQICLNSILTSFFTSFFFLACMQKCNAESHVQTRSGYDFKITSDFFTSVQQPFGNILFTGMLSNGTASYHFQNRMSLSCICVYFDCHRTSCTAADEAETAAAKKTNKHALSPRPD